MPQGGGFMEHFPNGPGRRYLREVSASSHKWEAHRRRRFGRFSRRERRAYFDPCVRNESGAAGRKIGQSAIGPPGWLEKGPSASLLVRYVSLRIRASLTPRIQTLLKPTVCLPLMRRCTSVPQSGNILQTLFLPVSFGNQSCPIPIVLESLYENRDSGAD